MSATERSHDRVAWCYDEIASVYSRGQIAAAKAWQVDALAPGARVLYVGVGSGEDARLAAARGARVTALDCAPAMLRRFEARLQREDLRAEVVERSVFDYTTDRPYDAVAANFFLNVFSPAEVTRVLAHLASLLRPGGQLLVADFAPPRGSPLARAIATAYYRPVNVAAWALGLAPLHPIYDYRPLLEPLGLRLESSRGFAVWRGGPTLYESFVAVAQPG